MTANPSFEPGDIPVINPLYLLRWEDTQNAYVLLYPEGVVKLNESAGEILKLCDGRKSIEELIGELRRLYSVPGQDIEGGIHRFLEASYAKGWIRNKA